VAASFHSLTVSKIDRQTPDAVAVSFDLPLDAAEAFAFRPGQYVTLRTKIDGRDVRRPYSICSVPESGTLTVGVKRVDGGAFSTLANTRLAVGDRLDVMPPDGRFGVKIGGVHDYLLIAAGSGITPMMSIARTVLEREPESRVTLLFGNRDTGSIMFRDALDDLKDRFLGRLAVLHCLSRETHAVELLNGRIDGARVRDLAARGIIDPLDADAIFLCGPGGMIDDVSETLRALGVVAAVIRTERFTPADDAPAAPVITEATRTLTREGVAVDAILDGVRRHFVMSDPQTSVLDAARDAGIELPFSCAGGMCCTCRCRIVEGATEMAVNYSLEAWEIDAGFTLACQSRPTSERLVLDFDAV